MITKLTDAQIARFPEFVKKWTDIGLCTLPADRVRAEHGIRLAYETAKLNAPLKIVWTTSPLAQILAESCVLQMQKENSVRASVHASVHDSVHDSVYASVLASVHDSVHASVRASVQASVLASVRASVLASVHASVYDSVHDSVYDSVHALVYASVHALVRNRFDWWFGNGQHDAPWCAYINFFREVLALEYQTDKAEAYREICESAGWISPHQRICWIAERHHRVCRNSRGRLHSHDGMAIEYPDGWGVWAWNGIRVTEQIILRPETLTAEQIAKESNAQVRQVMVERVGIERVCQMMQAKTIDRKTVHIGETAHPYELLALTVGTVKARYLKMVNPSIGVYHLEGVQGKPKTVDEALHLRKPGWMQKIPISNEGLSWQQQGDVYIVPDGAARLKPYPDVLT